MNIQLKAGCAAPLSVVNSGKFGYSYLGTDGTIYNIDSVSQENGGLMNSVLGNWRTSLIGFAAAMLNYLVALGPNLPHTGKEWGGVMLSAILATWGIAMKDANVGSKAP